MARRKNVKRIDPRYFLNETVNRGEELEERMPGIPQDVQQQRDRAGLGLGGKKAQQAAQEKLAKEAAADAADAADVRGQQWDYLYGMYLDQIRNSMGLRESDENIEELEEGCGHADHGAAIDISAPGMEVHVDDISQLSPEEAFAAGMAAARDAIDQVMGGPDGPPPEGGFSGSGPMGEPAAEEE